MSEAAVPSTLDGADFQIKRSKDGTMSVIPMDPTGIIGYKPTY